MSRFLPNTSCMVAALCSWHQHRAVILACAWAGKVKTLLTFNERQFSRLATEGIQVVVPL